MGDIDVGSNENSVFEQARTVTIDGVPLAYRERGAGDPVVFVHGAVSDLRTWMAQLEGLGTDHRAVTYSGRYARPSRQTPPAGDSPGQVDVADLAEFLRAVDACPAHLVGNSSGALTCLLTAIRHPGLVRTLTLEEPPATSLLVSTPPRPAELLRLLMRRPRTAAAIVRMGLTSLDPAEKALRRDDDAAAMHAFLRGVLGSAYLDDLSESRLRQARENLISLKAMLLGDGLPELVEEDVRGVSAPTLLLVGRDSPAFSQRLADRVAELLPRVTRVAIPNASHLMHEDNPAAVNDAIHAFIAEHGAHLHRRPGPGSTQ